MDVERKELVRRCLFGGMCMSACAVLIWFLITNSLRAVAISIMGVAVIVAALHYLYFRFVKGKRRIITICTRFVLGALSVLLFFSVTVYSLAPAFLFYPWFDEASYDTLQTCSNVEELELSKDGHTVGGWMLHNVEGKAPLLLYFGGNGENASARMLNIIRDKEVAAIFQGYNIATVDYPGYGKSSGTPSEASLKQMGLAAYDALTERDDVDLDNIVIFGYSIGTGVSNYVAANREVAGLIEMAPYADGYDLYNSMVNVFYGPVRLLVGFRMESVSFAEHVAVQPLMLASQGDEVVPYESTVRLSNAYPAGSSLVTIEGIKHNDFWGSDTAYQAIKAYLLEVLENEQQ